MKLLSAVALLAAGVFVSAEEPPPAVVLKASTMITNATFEPFTVYALAALLYFLLCWPLSRYSRFLEKQFHAAHHY